MVDWNVSVTEEREKNNAQGIRQHAIEIVTRRTQKHAPDSVVATVV